MIAHEPSYLASDWTSLARPIGGQAAAMERVEIRALADALVRVEALPTSAFYGNWAGGCEEASLSDILCPQLVSVRWPPAPHAQPDEIFMAYSNAVHDPERMAELSPFVFGSGRAHAPARRAEHPASTVAQFGAGVSALAFPPVEDESAADAVGWCHQCKRKGTVRRCEHSQPIDVLRRGLTALEVVQCRRNFCPQCLDKYPRENPADALYREGKLRCPSCRGLCTCPSCLRTRAGKSARAYKAPRRRPQQPAEPKEAATHTGAGLADAAGSLPQSLLGADGAAAAAAAEPAGAAALAAPAGRPEAASPLRAPPGAAMPTARAGILPCAAAGAAPLAQQAARAPVALPPLPCGPFKKCRARCPACGHEHRLRVRRVAPDAAPLVPYACDKCAHPFQFRVAAAGGGVAGVGAGAAAAASAAAASQSRAPSG